MHSTLKALISAPAAAFLRDTIRDARGNEVFFLAKLDEHGVVVEVTPLARGNESAVPALLQVTSPGDVVIHNHPSGHLTPSPADVSLASEYGNQGVGFYIINNAADRLYVVVEAFKRQQRQLLDPNQLALEVSPKGRIAQRLQGFESRREQQRMLHAVATAFNESKIALIEAGTGTGKSLAYLLPAIHWAVQNKQRVVISTNTINLQEQLMHKDLPLLQQALDLKFKPVLVKGRQNYVCLSKVEALEKEGDYLIETDERTELKVILEWSHRTAEGSRSDLNILPRFSVWEKVACESDNCTRIRCDHYNKCFFYNARREAASADLLIVNHHLLFSDVAVRGDTGRYNEAAILPPYANVILDEAHNVEDVATDYFGTQIAKLGLLRLLARFYSLREREKVKEKGLLPHLLARLQSLEKKIEPGTYSKIYGHVQNRMITQRENLVHTAAQTFDDLAAWLCSTAETGAEQKVRFTPKVRERPEWKGMVLPAVQNLIREMGEFHQQLLLLEGWLESLDEAAADSLLSLTVELNALIDRLESAAATLGEIFGDADGSRVRWIEMTPSRMGQRITLKQAPVNVAELMRERLFDKLQTVVLTSATLTTESRFDYVKGRLGLDQVKATRLLECVLTSSFDYSRQVILGIPQDIPSPNDGNFAAELGRLVLESIRISEGRALVLFTSYALLRRIHQELAATLESAGIRALVQGEGPRHRLTGAFKQDKTSVLFATDSFWEGVDVVGEALENVILTKLPFSVPKEPVVEARVEAIEQAGGNPFLEYSVPQAVIKFKQGFGRLIRSRTDRGSIMIFDRRVVDKTYGKVFLRSLPTCRLVQGKSRHVFNEVKQFFESTQGQRPEG
ncbi:MAG: DEAD/DEAH box helicase [Acidimicrobiia bacterium]|nr:DEAD/DEAH box helicase [Acidimicrobiia bacterium]